MSELKALTCKNCGAPINRATMKCEYCDTQYERTYEGTQVKFIADRPGVHTLRAMAMIDEEMIRSDPGRAKEFIERKLRQSLADGLMEYMRTEEEMDYRSFARIIRAEVKVVSPQKDTWEMELENNRVLTDIQREELRRRLRMSISRV